MKPTVSKMIFVATTLSLCVHCLNAQQISIKLSVDLTDADRHLVSSTLEVPVKPGRAKFWYPKWINGKHSPFGSVKNLAGLTFETSSGQNLNWYRESKEPYLFFVDVPENTDHLIVKIRYIANESHPSSDTAQAEFVGDLGYFNWNTCILYPEVDNCETLRVYPTLTLPPFWKMRTALRVSESHGQFRKFEPVSLTKLIDSPVVAGKFGTSIQLNKAGPGLPPHFIHVFGERQGDEILPGEVINSYKKLVHEAHRLFGSTPYDSYHFLLLVCDTIDGAGLEHLSSSLNIISTDEMFNPGERIGWAAELLPHEFVHAWCGKFRRPEGMSQRAFHQDKRLNLLWVYEGLTEHLGGVLAVRSGLQTGDQYSQVLADRWNLLAKTGGRKWRSLEDTAVTSYQLRDLSLHWEYRRRNQDFYDEGALFWLEVDSIIRKETTSRISLDDFCKLFFGGKYKNVVLPYTEKQLVEKLNQVCPFNWNKLIEERIKSPQPVLKFDFLKSLGREFVYGKERTEYLANDESLYGYFDESHSFGMLIDDQSGQIDSLIPDSPADRARLAEEDRILTVDGRRFSRSTFRSILDKKEKAGEVEFVVRRHGKDRVAKLKFDPKHRYARLIRGSGSDVLSNILSPKTNHLPKLVPVKTKIQVDDFDIKALDQRLNDVAAMEAFNGAVVLVEEGKPIFQKYIGYSNVETGQAFSVSAAFRLASVSKQFTAMAIMLLANDKKLEYDDKVSQFIPEFPYPDVTIRNLLHHTGGLPDYMDLFDRTWESQKPKQQRTIVTNRDVVALFAKSKPKTRFKAGTKFEYSNTGYVLLAEVVSRVSGLEFAEFLDKQIFEKLDMADSQVCSSQEFAPKHRVFGFAGLPHYSNHASNDYYYLNGVVGDGGVYASVRDLIKWDSALYSDKLIGQEKLIEAFQPGGRGGIQQSEYGFGWQLDYGSSSASKRLSTSGKPPEIVKHSGSWVGFVTYIGRNLKTKRMVLILSNNRGRGFDTVQDLIAKTMTNRKRWPAK